MSGESFDFKVFLIIFLRNLSRCFQNFVVYHLFESHVEASLSRFYSTIANGDYSNKSLETKI